MAAKKYPAQEELRKRLRYEPETGLLFWLPKEAHETQAARFNAVLAGREAGAKHSAPGSPTGFARAIGFIVDGRKTPLLAHRVVWIMANGPIPEGMVIDHVNGDNCDNRLVNLRLATHSQNMRNRKVHKQSRWKVAGVKKHHRRWHAHITVDHITYQLGSFATIQQAAEARRQAEIKYFGQFAPCLSRR